MPIHDDLGNLCSHRITVNFVPIAVPVIPPADALTYAQHVYGRYAICIREGMGSYCPKLSEADLERLSDVDGDCYALPESDDQALLLRIKPRFAFPAEITVYYVQRMRERPSARWRGGRPLAGCSVHFPDKPAVTLAADASRWTLPHELGHVLLRSVGAGFPHSMSSDNVMYDPSSKIVGDPPVLTKDQLDLMRGSPYCIAC